MVLDQQRDNLEHFGKCGRQQGTPLGRRCQHSTFTSRPNANFYDTLDSTYCLTISTIQFLAWNQTRWTKRSMTMAMTNTPGKGFAVRPVSVL